MNREALIEELKRDEGVVFTLYKCSAGKNTIGVGRNLDDRGITEDESDCRLGGVVSDDDVKLTENVQGEDRDTEDTALSARVDQAQDRVCGGSSAGRCWLGVTPVDL